MEKMRLAYEQFDYIFLCLILRMANHKGFFRQKSYPRVVIKINLIESVVELFI